MNKSDLIRSLAKRCEISHSLSKSVIDNFMEIVTLAMLRGEIVTIYGFGKFFAKYYKKSTLFSNLTSNKRVLPARFLPKFTPSNSLKRHFRHNLGQN